MSKKLASFPNVLIPSLEQMDGTNARFVLTMQLSPEIRARMDVLMSLSKKGILTAEQKREAEYFLNLGSLLTIMHSKARVAIKKSERRTTRRKSA